MIFKIFFIIYFFSTFVIAKDYYFSNISKDLMINLGKEVYFSKSSDSCAKCHGDITKSFSKDKGLENSANLKDPKTWIAFKALGAFLIPNLLAAFGSSPADESKD